MPRDRGFLIFVAGMLAFFALCRGPMADHDQRTHSDPPVNCYDHPEWC